MTTATTEPATARAAAAGRRLLRHATHPTLLLNAAAPVASYEILTACGASELTALALGALFPLVAVARTALRRHRLDLIGMFALAGIVLVLVAGVLLDSPQLLLLKDSVLTGGAGIAFLVSLALRRPLSRVLRRELSGTDGGYPMSVYRFSTLVWGIALTGDAALRAGLSFVLAPPVLLLVSPLLAAAVFGPVAAWTLRRSRVSQAAPDPAPGQPAGQGRHATGSRRS